MITSVARAKTAAVEGRRSRARVCRVAGVHTLAVMVHTCQRSAVLINQNLSIEVVKSLLRVSDSLGPTVGGGKSMEVTRVCAPSVCVLIFTNESCNS